MWVVKHLLFTTNNRDDVELGANYCLHGVNQYQLFSRHHLFCEIQTYEKQCDHLVSTEHLLHILGDQYYLPKMKYL